MNLPFRDVDNVVVTDTLPVGVTFKNFTKQTALGISATTSVVGGRTIIKWTIPKMQVNMKDSLMFLATVTGTCPLTDNNVINNAWIQGQTESPVSSKDTILVTCLPITVCPEATTITKTSDKTKYSLGETVKYSIGFTQTIGSIANPMLSSNTDWTTQSGSGGTYGASSIVFGSGVNAVATYDYSYGTNTLGDGIEGTFKITDNEGQGGLVVRHSGGAVGNGVYIVFKKEFAGTYVDVYNGTTKLTASSTFIAVSPASGLYDFRIKLSGTTMSLWLVASGDAISGPATATYTGIPNRAGYAGLFHGSIFGSNNPYSAFTLLGWKTHLDAAFNVTITDPVPVGIINPLAISGTGSNVSNVVTWKLVTGKTPMLYNATATLTWDGTFNLCQKITNIAYVNALGLDVNQYGDCYEIECGSTICTPPSGVLLTASSSPSICEGDSVLLMALPVSGSKYEYVFMREGTTVQGPGTKNTYYAKTSGDYSVSVYPVGDPLCEATPAAVTVEVHALPTATLSASATAQCEGTVTLTAAGGTGSWEYSFVEVGGINLPVISTIDNYTVSKSGSYYAIVYNSSNSNCYSYTDTIEIQIDTRPTLALTSNSVLSACKGTAGGLIEVTAITGGVYSWTDENGALSTQTNSYAPALPGTYSVTVISGLCDVSLVDIEVVELALPEYTISTTDPQSICVGSAFPEVASTITGIAIQLYL
ncbi:MAG: hypothetical protein IPO21_04325 [Bacteroidales bacterium]|nr:hypothetical protein [Bacteroidales bacterium]